MTTATASRASRTSRRVRELWAELDHANRRVLEIRTGIPFGTREDLRRTRRALSNGRASSLVEDPRVSGR